MKTLIRERLTRRAVRWFLVRTAESWGVQLAAALGLTACGVQPVAAMVWAKGLAWAGFGVQCWQAAKADAK